ncbi:MAG: polyribonucleotide nucleotidyltransferase, partial [Dehalococcoidia bacterium]
MSAKDVTETEDTEETDEIEDTVDDDDADDFEEEDEEEFEDEDEDEDEAAEPVADDDDEPVAEDAEPAAQATGQPEGQRTFSREIEGIPFEIGTGLFAQNAAASCTIRYGDTMVLVTVCDDAGRPGLDFLPLTVDFEERMYAIGKIPGSFFRREGRPGNDATLAARMTDRPIRPLFPKGYRREVHVVLTLLSSDRDMPADVFGATGASIVLGMSLIPFQGPVSSVRVGRVDGEFKAFPTYTELEESDLDLIVAGTEESVVMIEAGAKEVPEADIADAIDYAREVIEVLNDLQKEVVEALGVDKLEFEPSTADEELLAKVSAVLDGEGERMLNAVKDEGFRGVDALGRWVTEEIDDEEIEYAAVRRVIEDVVKAFVRARVLSENKRVDGRAADELRELSSQVGLIPRGHGSGLFQRGGTQVLSVATLGAIGDRQRLDNIHPAQFKTYMHHYNFPPYSVGEARFLRGPGRREIGHGLLAERALEPVLPGFEQFPYTMRVVSDTLMSNGSSSMASVCGSTLALMDAGVPISAPVAGVAMGLITDEESDDYRILTDIAGIEDAFGDMDFKVAGTEAGVTAVQLDTKLKSLPADVVDAVFAQAREARLQILDSMASAIDAPRESVGKYTPKIVILKINPEKIGSVIGPGGKVINRIQSETGASIDIEDDGSVFIGGADSDSVDQAVDWVNGLTKEVEVGEVYEGPVTRILNFGAFVEILPGKDGLVHISELEHGRTETVEDVLDVGDMVKVKVIEIDNLGRVNLSRAALLEGGGDGRMDGPDDGPDDSLDDDDDGYEPEDEDELDEEEIPRRGTVSVTRSGEGRGGIRTGAAAGGRSGGSGGSDGGGGRGGRGGGGGGRGGRGGGGGGRGGRG